MATNAAPPEQTLFVRKASGLVKGWSTGDGFRYSFFSTNIFLGIWGFLYAVFIPGGSVFWSIIITTLFVLLEVVVYAGLISAMPRAGGDYVWQSRVFHSSVGFVFGATGWWFILWLWIPIYAALCVNSFIKPILRILGAGGTADWLATKNGIFVASLATIALATYLVAVGMKAYARFQKWALWIGLAGCAVAAILLLVTSKTGFITAFNREALHLYGAKDAYAATIKNAGAEVIIIAAISLIVLGWWGTVFLSSTRMIFASAFDRILPEGVARVTSGGVPVVALLLMAIPSIIVSAFYAYQPSFVKLTYDATLVIAAMFFVTGLAFMVMPWRAKSIWENSALPKMKILGVPVLAIVAAIYSLFMAFNLWLWFYDKANVYGVGYKNKNSMIFMGIFYVAAIVIWIVAWAVRKRQGMALEAVAKEIPVE